MTYNTNTPNASISPGLFPAQSNVNFSRLKTIIDGDHVFNDSAAANDGRHRQVTVINRADPVSLPAGTNGILYSKVDSVSGATQLFFYNGTSTISQLTPNDLVAPIRVTGSATLNPNNTQVIFNPSYNYFGIGYAILNSGSEIIYNMYSIGKIGSNTTLDKILEIGSDRPTLSYDGTNLRIRNNKSSPRTVQWSLIVNRL